MVDGDLDNLLQYWSGRLFVTLAVLLLRFTRHCPLCFIWHPVCFRCWCLVCGGLTWESLVSLLQIKAETEHSRKVGAGTCLLVHMYLKDSMAVGLPEVLLYPRGRLCDHTQSWVVGIGCLLSTDCSLIRLYLLVPESSISLLMPIPEFLLASDDSQLLWWLAETVWVQRTYMPKESEIQIILHLLVTCPITHSLHLDSFSFDVHFFSTPFSCMYIEQVHMAELMTCDWSLLFP